VRVASVEQSPPIPTSSLFLTGRHFTVSAGLAFLTYSPFFALDLGRLFFIINFVHDVEQ
jgi:hypothetical protein